MEECFEEWKEQFAKLEENNDELLEGDHIYAVWEAFQAGWEAHTCETDKKIREVYEKLGVKI